MVLSEVGTLGWLESGERLGAPVLGRPGLGMEPEQVFNSSVFFMMNASWDMNNLTFYPRQKSLAMDLEILQKIVPILVPILFSIIIITGFIGNLLVVCVVTLNKNMMNTTNLLILNLAVRKCLVKLCICHMLNVIYRTSF